MYREKGDVPLCSLLSGEGVHKPQILEAVQALPHQSLRRGRQKSIPPQDQDFQKATTYSDTPSNI